MILAALVSIQRNSSVLVETNYPPPQLQRQVPHTMPVSRQTKRQLRGTAPGLPRKAAQIARHRHELKVAAKHRQASTGMMSLPQLLPAHSHLPTEASPPIALVRPHSVGAGQCTVFEIGDRVRVRRFSCATDPPAWTEWRSGNVVAHVLGSSGNAHLVHVESGGTVWKKGTVEKFVQSLGEIVLDDYLDADVESDYLAPVTCPESTDSADHVNTQCHTSTSIADFPHEDVLAPGKVLKYRKGPGQSVQTLKQDQNLPPPAALASYRPTSYNDFISRCQWTLYGPDRLYLSSHLSM